MAGKTKKQIWDKEVAKIDRWMFSEMGKLLDKQIKKNDSKIKNS